MNSTAAASVRVLHVVPSFYPAVGFGGPIFSTLAICDHVADQLDMQIDVLTTDTAGGPVSGRLDLAENPTVFPKGYKVRYCRRVAGAAVSPELLVRLPSAIRKADVVHLTGPYSFPVLPTLFLCRLFRKPVVWSPRGGLLATAQWPEAPSQKFKAAFERLCNFVRPRSTVLHVTSKTEGDLSCDRLLGIRTHTIPNSIDVPETLPERTWRPDGRLRLVFLSRVHEKKGLETLLSAMRSLPTNVTLDIYGGGEADYLARLHQLIGEYGLGERVAFHGHVDGAAKARAFTSGDLFCLPTHSENFGIVVAEALAHGMPVITTVNAPWEELETKRCGLWVEMTEAALAEAIERLSGADLKQMGALGRAWMQRDFTPQGMGQSFATLYRDLAHQKARTPQ